MHLSAPFLAACNSPPPAIFDACITAPLPRRFFYREIMATRYTRLAIVCALAVCTNARPSKYEELHTGTLRLDHVHARVEIDLPRLLQDPHDSAYPVSILVSGTRQGERPAPPLNIPLAPLVADNATFPSSAFYTNHRAVHIDDITSTQASVFVKPTSQAVWVPDEDKYAIPVLVRIGWDAALIQRQLAVPFTRLERAGTCLAATEQSKRLMPQHCTNKLIIESTQLLFTNDSVYTSRNRAVHGETEASSLHIGACELLLFYSMYYQQDMRCTAGVVVGIHAAAAAATIAWLYVMSFAETLRDVKHAEVALYGGSLDIDPVFAVMARSVLTPILAVMCQIHDPTGSLEIVKRRFLLFMATMALSIPFSQASHGNTQTNYLLLIFFVFVVDNMGDGIVAAIVALYDTAMLHRSGHASLTSVTHHVLVAVLCVANYAIFLTTSLYTGAHLFFLDQGIHPHLAREIYMTAALLYSLYIFIRVAAKAQALHRLCDGTQNDAKNPLRETAVVTRRRAQRRAGQGWHDRQDP